MRLSTRLALAMVSLVLVTTAVLSVITYHLVAGVALPSALDRLATKAMLIASNLETVLNSVGQDVASLQNSNGVAQLGVARTALSASPMAAGSWFALSAAGQAARSASFLTPN